MCGSCTGPWRPIWWRRRNVVVCWGRSGTRRGPLYFLLCRFKTLGGKEEGKNWPQVTTRVPTTSSREERERKKKTKFLWLFLISSALPTDGCSTIWITGVSSFSHTEEIWMKLFLPFCAGCIKIKAKCQPFCCVLAVGLLFIVLKEKWTHTHTRTVCHGKRKKTWKTRQSKSIGRYARWRIRRDTVSSHSGSRKVKNCTSME